jgi:hypothetical protein
MHFRLIASLAIVCIALGAGGCSSVEEKRKSSERHYKEVFMPLQTGSHFQRRILVPFEPEKKPSKKKQQSTAPKREPNAEASATPAPEEESTPPAEKFR